MGKASKLTFAEFVSRIDDVFETDDINDLATNPAFMRYVSDNTYVFRQGTRRERTFVFPEGHDRLRAAEYILYVKKGGLEDFS